MAVSTATEVGLFIATWEIGTSLPDAPKFQLAATVDTPRKTLNGTCHMGRVRILPPEFASDVNGSYSYMTVMPDQSHILVVATGTDYVSFPPPAIGSMLMTNLQLRMVLGSDWKSGTANIKYYISGQGWQELEDLPVALVPNADASDASA